MWRELAGVTKFKCEKDVVICTLYELHDDLGGRNQIDDILKKSYFYLEKRFQGVNLKYITKCQSPG